MSTWQSGEPFTPEMDEAYRRGRALSEEQHCRPSTQIMFDQSPVAEFAERAGVSMVPFKTPPDDIVAEYGGRDDSRAAAFVAGWLDGTPFLREILPASRRDIMGGEGRSGRRGRRELMGLRFRRSFRLVPGFRLNISRSGPSVSVGGRGAWLTFGGKRGTRTTIGIPGTGLSYTTTLGSGKASPRRGQASVHVVESDPSPTPHQSAAEALGAEQSREVRKHARWIGFLVLLFLLAVAWQIARKFGAG